MFTQTCTETQSNDQQPLTIHQKLRSQASWESVCQKALTELTGILDEYGQRRDAFGEWKDSLSDDIFELCGNMIVDIDLNEDNMTKEELLKFAKKRIHHLMKDILVNPLFEEMGTLNNPVLDGEWVWEDWILEDCKSCCLLNPWDDKPFYAVKKTHEFAMDILGWVKRLPTGTYDPSDDTQLQNSNDSQSKNTKPLNAALVSSCQTPELKMMKMMMYIQRAKSARLTKSMKDKILKPLQEGEVLASKMWDEARKMVQEEVEIAKRDLEAHNKRMDQRFEQTENNHDQKFNVLKDVIAEEVKQREIISENLKVQDQKCEEQDQKIQQLEGSIVEQKIEFTNKKTEILQKVDQTVNLMKQEFDQELEAKDQAVNQTVNRLETQHQRKLEQVETKLTNEINETNERLKKEKTKAANLATNLSRMTQANAANVRRNEELRASIADQARQIKHLAKKAKKKKFGIF